MCVSVASFYAIARWIVCYLSCGQALTALLIGVQTTEFEGISILEKDCFR